jgi:hypothetical protein
MGCSEVVVSNLVGPLSLNLVADQSIAPVNHPASYWVYITGRASTVTWNFGDGTVATNQGAGSAHQWANPGAYTITCTAYNLDNPAGVSASTVLVVQPLIPPQLQPVVLLSNGFHFQFAGQTGANYTIQYATNLAPPVKWQTLQNIYYSSGGQQQITDTANANSSRYYRVLVQ